MCYHYRCEIRAGGLSFLRALWFDVLHGFVDGQDVIEHVGVLIVIEEVKTWLYTSLYWMRNVHIISTCQPNLVHQQCWMLGFAWSVGDVFFVFNWRWKSIQDRSWELSPGCQYPPWKLRYPYRLAPLKMGTFLFPRWDMGTRSLEGYHCHEFIINLRTEPKVRQHTHTGSPRY